MEVHFLKILRRVLIPAATLVAESKLSQEKKGGCVCRPSELPIYQPEPTIQPNVECEDTTPQAIENAFATARRGITKLYGEIDAYKRVSKEYIEETRNNAEWLLRYLRQEDNTTPKAGAIAIGGLTGFIFGLRGGMFRRLFYASVGALGMAAVCYPKEASEYSQIGLTEGKKYMKIAYNFAYGGEAEKDLDLEDKKVIVETDFDEEEPEEDDKIDPLAIVSEAHEQASQSCHCPIGACLGQHDDGLEPPPDSPESPDSLSESMSSPDPEDLDEEAK